MNAETANDGKNDIAGLREEIARLGERLAALEGGSGGGDGANPRGGYERAGDGGTDYAGRFTDAFQKSMDDSRRRRGEKFALGVATFVTHRAEHGSFGTAYGILGVETAAELPGDDDLARRQARLAPVVNDPLVPRLLRAFLALRFEDRPMRATADELAGRVGAAAEAVEASLRPLAASDLIRRGLGPDDAPFYEWDGYSHPVITLLFHD